MINFGLETWANILISVIIYVVGLVLVLFIANLIFAAWFKQILKKHSAGMSVTLNAKFDNIKKLFDIMKKLNVKFDEKYIETINSIDINSFKHQWTDECKKAREKLTYLRDEAMFIARSQKNLEKNNEFITAKNNVLEMDTVYRNIVACYNADVLGYNYWIRFLPFRWFWKMIKVKTKDLI